MIDKLKVAKGRLKEWNQKECGHLDQNISTLEEKINEIDLSSNSQTLTDEELSHRRSAQSELWTWLSRKEVFWAQNSRAKWLKEGDRNTKYFHTLASIHKRKISILSLSTNSFIIDSPAGIQDEGVSFFLNIFQEDYSSRPTFEGLKLRKLSSLQAEKLITPFTSLEIDEEVNSCNPQKAPGPDGYNFSFIKEAWEVIKWDVYNTLDDFRKSSQLSKGSNVAFITLIEKCESDEGFKDFRPISMIGCIYKIIAKVLARRLQQVMDSLIGP